MSETTDNCKAGGRCAPAPGSGHVIAGARLRCLIANAHRILGKKYKGSPLWAMVSDLTSHGSSISSEICTQAGYAPCQPCGAKELIAPNTKLTDRGVNSP